MNDALGFVLLGIVILSAMICPLAIYRAVRYSRMLPAIVAITLAALAIFCSLPFAETYETPWMPEVTVVYFAFVAFISLVFVLRRPVVDAGNPDASPRRRRFSVLAQSALSVVLLVFCVGVWNEYEGRSQVREEAWNALKFLTSVGVNTNRADDGFTVLSFSQPEIITDADVEVLFVPALRNSRWKFHVVDLKGTQVTEDGAQAIVAALPDCEVRL